MINFAYLKKKLRVSANITQTAGEMSWKLL